MGKLGRKRKRKENKSRKPEGGGSIRRNNREQTDERGD